MNLSSIQLETQSSKKNYWEWMRDLTGGQAALLFTFSRDALDQEGKRGEHLDSKGNWVVAACLGGMTLLAVAGRAVVNGLSADAYFITAVGIVVSVICFILAATWVVWGVRVSGGWYPPNPELILRPEIFTDKDTDLARDLILHYVENFSSNRRVSDQKAKTLKVGQSFMFAGVFMTVAIGVVRLFL